MEILSLQHNTQWHEGDLSFQFALHDDIYFSSSTMQWRNHTFFMGLISKNLQNDKIKNHGGSPPIPSFYESTHRAKGDTAQT